jgi:subtilisin family serine protease
MPPAIRWCSKNLLFSDLADVYGINAVTGSGDPMDDNMHGTHCAGTVGAQGNNTLGVVGVAPEVSIMACKFLTASGSGSISDALVCLDYAVGMGVPISSK